MPDPRPVINPQIPEGDPRRYLPSDQWGSTPGPLTQSSVLPLEPKEIG